MRTSKTIKGGQSAGGRATIVVKSKDAWTVEGRQGDLYQVSRIGHNCWSCSCRAGQRGLLCRHVTSVVKTLTAAAHMEKVSVWTCEEDAQRQHRPMLKLRLAGGGLFWMTHTWPGWVPRVNGAKITIVKDAHFGQCDIYYEKGAKVWRRSCQGGGVNAIERGAGVLCEDAATP